MITATNFSAKIDQILKFLGESVVESDTVKANLHTSAFLDIRNKLLNRISDDHFSSEISSLNPGQTLEEIAEFNKKFEEKIKSFGFNFDEEFNASCKNVLEDFVKELRPKLEPDKIEGLQKIISE